MVHNRILVALNPADGPDSGFERALTLAKSSGAELYLLHAVPADQPFGLHATERLQRAADLRRRAEAAGVRVVATEQHGDPAEIIVLHADARPVDFIVMGTERRTGWARWRQPSVAERVLRRTKRPTLVVPAGDATLAGFEHVLVAVDLSPASTALAASAMDLLGSGVRQLTAIHAVDSIEATDALRNRARRLVPEYRGYVLDEARRRLRALFAEGGGTVTPRLHVSAGAAAETIRAYAASAEADLIVMGRTKRFMDLGSIAVRLLRNTDRALLVIPPEALAQTVDANQVIEKRAA